MDQYGTSSCSLTEEDLEDFIEVPRLDDGDIFAAVHDTEKSQARDRALQVALTAELTAQRYYTDLVEHTSEGSLKRLYQELAEMEDGHVAYIQRKLAPREIKDKNVN